MARPQRFKITQKPADPIKERITWLRREIREIKAAKVRDFRYMTDEQRKERIAIDEAEIADLKTNL